MKFKTKLLSAGKTATGIEVPAAVVESLGAGKKPPVKITFNGYTYRNTIAVMGGVYMVGVSAEHRAASGVKAGDELNVSIELDNDPRVVAVPEALQDALNKNPIAKKHFELISNSKKKAIVIPVSEAKTDETRQRRIEKAILLLTTGNV